MLTTLDQIRGKWDWFCHLSGRVGDWLITNVLLNFQLQGQLIYLPPASPIRSHIHTNTHTDISLALLLLPPLLPSSTGPNPAMDPISIPFTAQFKKNIHTHTHRVGLFAAACRGRAVAEGQHGLPSLNRLALIRQSSLWMQKPMSAPVWPIFLRLCSELIHQAGSQALILCSDNETNGVFPQIHEDYNI